MDMPKKIWALPESELTGPYTTSPIWSDLPLNTSFVPYIRADLVREAMEALSEASLTLEQVCEGQHEDNVCCHHLRAVSGVLAKLKEAGL